MSDTKTAKIQVAVDCYLNRLESLRSKRNAVEALIGEPKKAIDKRSGEIKTAIAIELKKLDVVSGCTLATELSKSPYGADNTVRQRYQRRRNWLMKALKGLHPCYDILSVRGRIRSELVGDSACRQARVIHSNLQEWKIMGFSMSSTLDDIEKTLRGGRISPTLDKVEDGLPSSAELVEAVRNGGDAQSGDTAEKTEKVEKVEKVV